MSAPSSRRRPQIRTLRLSVDTTHCACTHLELAAPHADEPCAGVASRRLFRRRRSACARTPRRRSTSTTWPGRAEAPLLCCGRRPSATPRRLSQTPAYLRTATPSMERTLPSGRTSTANMLRSSGSTRSPSMTTCPSLASPARPGISLRSCGKTRSRSGAGSSHARTGTTSSASTIRLATGSVNSPSRSGTLARRRRVRPTM
jgi:hypothetical protein